MLESSSSRDASSSSLADRAVELAHRWVIEAAAAEVSPAVDRLGEILQDPDGFSFACGMVDGVVRPESWGAAAAQFRRVAAGVPSSLPWYLRSAVRAGGEIAPILPAAMVPLARRVVREFVGHLVIDARPEKLESAIAKLREAGSELSVALLGEPVLGDRDAARRLDDIHELIRRPDVDSVSLSIPAVFGRIPGWAFEESTRDVAQRLLPLYLSAASDGTVITLELEQHRDLSFTIAVFMRLLEDPRLRFTEAGLVLQTYLPDALPTLQELTAWARERVDSGGAPIAVRLVKGANLASERAEARLSGWTPAPYDTKLDADANHLRCLDWALRPGNADAVRVRIAGHNRFGIAYAWLLAGEREVRDRVEFEMLLGVAPAQVQAVSREVGRVRVYAPAVNADAFEVAIPYLLRRLEESSSADNFLSSARRLATDDVLFERERNRFLDAVDRATAPTLRLGARHTQSRLAPLHEAVRPVPDAPSPEQALTGAVLSISSGSRGGDALVETAVYSRHELPEPAEGAPGFVNATDTDPALPANREWARQVVARIPASTLGDITIARARVDDFDALNAAIDTVHAASEHWSGRGAADRSAVLLRAAAALEGRRGELIEVAGSETGMTFSAADAEASAAVDFARYYAATSRELDAIAGAAFEPARVTAVVPSWNSPLATPASGVLAALATGSGVVLRPEPRARRCAAVLAEALWQAGVPRDVLRLADIENTALVHELVGHEKVDRVILTGSRGMAAQFRSLRAERSFLADTGGRNAMIIAPSADLDLATADLVHSAFKSAGQDRAAVSLAILVGQVGRSKRFARKLADATRSLRLGEPTELRTDIGPLIERPQGGLAWALGTLDGDEQWLIEPAPAADDDTGRFWRPGIRVGVQPDSRFHSEEFSGPVLGIMHAPSLERAIELQNEFSSGLVAGLHTQNPADLALWLERVQAGNLYVNRAVTGAIVQRQPFGGWNRSVIGGCAKAGGPNHLIALGSWRSLRSGASSSTLHLRGLDSRISALIEASQPSLEFEEFEWLRRSALSDALAWDREFGQVRDVSRLGVERNLFRYRPVAAEIRATEDAELPHLMRVVLAAVRAGVRFVLSTPTGLPTAVRRALSDLNAVVFMENNDEWIERMQGRGGSAEHTSNVVQSIPRPDDVDPSGSAEITSAQSVPVAGRVRLVGSREAVVEVRRSLAAALEGDIDLTVYGDDVTSAGRIELLPFVREQSISITAQRFGNPDRTFDSVI